MAKLFLNQAKEYVKTRPGYPQQLFDFISSKTPCHDLVWDVGTGSGQAAISLASIYKSVIGTDTSSKQIEFAPKLPNVHYKCTSANMSISELEEKIGIESSVDLVTVAQALHWFANDSFFDQVKRVLKKPNGVIAAWCYTTPVIDDLFDPVFNRFYAESQPYWDSLRGLVDDKYKTLKFPFEPVDGCDDTGPFEFKTVQLMSLDDFFTYIKSWSGYQTAKEKGVELLNSDVVEEFTKAWNEEGNGQKSVTYPVYLRIGKA
uniref:putative methyltransferase DDB_G0268948 n=1 Tax=Erigeron canadensis TaxID=72917 RepID=UPI001CB9275D|nr:putative methyltransferase DDB_G0268948 [Erigeron canadensis]